MIMVHDYCSWNLFDDLLKCLRFLQGFCHAIFFLVPITLIGNFRKKIDTHTRTTLLSFEKSWEKFFLKPFVFAIQF